jgi:GNAT superfamily N-acetyltransferase
MISEASTSQSGFRIRDATVNDRKAIRMLLPDLQQPAICVVATECEQNRIVGAAAASGTLRVRPLIGPGVAIEVIEPYRRRGIGRAMLGRLEVGVRRFSSAAQALYAAQRVEVSSGKAQSWAALGFLPLDRTEDHNLPTARFEAELGPLLERMHRRGKIPANAAIVPLFRADAAEVLQLHLDQMGGDRGELYRKIRGNGSGAFHPRYSRVLLIGGKVKGCILAHRMSAESAYVDANIVDPSVRGGWANVWLKLEATRCALRLNIKAFRFTSFQQYTDTRSFTERLGGHTTRTTELYYRQVGIAEA